MRTPKAKAPSKRSALEEKFLAVFLSAVPTAPKPEREFRFHPDRKWRFDFAWPRHKTAVEIDGGIFIDGGHNRGMQFAGDAEKNNAAVCLGWRVLKFTTIDLRQKPVQCVEQVAWLLGVVPVLENTQ